MGVEFIPHCNMQMRFSQNLTCNIGYYPRTSLTFARREAFDDRGVGLDAAAVHVPGGKGADFRLHSILRVQKQDGIEIGQRLVPEQRPTLRLEDAVEPFEERAAEIKFLALFGQDGGG